ncbi:hypothetical protein QE152_g13244 [Popillia japonica]|uniref:Uncharacterized protein n=1 Tax=Popillia japonica TaxID=7064 RepID=A0AAW1LEY5_POPJA
MQNFFAQAWDELPQNVLKNSWFKFLNCHSNQYDSNDDFPSAQLLQLLQKDQVWNEVLARKLGHLEEIEPNNSIGVDEIEESNEDVVSSH